MEKFDVVIIGAGSGGIGAAIAAGRLGLKVLVVEKQNFVGGNATQSGVSVWEMGVGGTGIPFEIYKKLKEMPQAVGIYSFKKHRKWQLKTNEKPLHPGAEIIIDKEAKYINSLRRFGSKVGILNEKFVKKNWHGVPFEPTAYQAVVEKMMAETGRITLLKNTSVTAVNSQDKRVVSLKLSNNEIISSPYYIDSTDSGFICQSVGCEFMYGQEDKQQFDEPNAPDVVSTKLNGVSLIYRIRPSHTEGVAQPPICWWADDYPPTSIVEYPNGDLNINMLPTMEGIEFSTYTNYALAYEECKKRVEAHFQHLRHVYPPYKDYQIVWIAPALGVREGKRIVGEYILKEQDIRAGLSKQEQQDIITIADHALDTHGKSTGRSGCKELEEPYGVPFRCLIPKGCSNLLIASRAASFSSLAASSCRLSRTMMQLGQAAGTAVYVAQKSNIPLKNIDYQDLKQLLLEQNVQLEHPMSPKLKKYLKDE
jgi:hypothetical protein